MESAVREYVTNLRLLFQQDADTEAWLTGQWIEEELEHGRLARNYVQDIWPEFNWPSAFAEYHARIPKQTTIHLRNTPALEALSRCVTETHAAMMYRCLASYTSDHRLKRLLLRFSQDETRHYANFRSIFESRNKSERNGLWRQGRTIIGRSELASGRDVSIAFSGLNKYWDHPAPFGRLSFEEFLRRLGRVMKTHYPTRSAARMLLRPLGANSFCVRAARWVFRLGIRAEIRALEARF